MHLSLVDIRKSTGKILSSTVFVSDGRKLLRKGHVINEADISELEAYGLAQVQVAEPESDEVDESQAAMDIAMEAACGAVLVQLATGGRANLFAKEPCCVLVDEQLLALLNATASVVISTTRNFSYAGAGQRIATVKSTPFAVPAKQVEYILRELQERGPLLQGRPIGRPNVAVLFTDPNSGENARRLFSHPLERRLASLGIRSFVALNANEDPENLRRCLNRLLFMRPTMVLIASTTAPAGPEDAVGRAIQAVGCTIERFMAPVEPGCLLLLGYHDQVPILSAPSCFYSDKPNVLDFMLPPLLARYRVTPVEIARLGHGGLLA